MAVRDRLVAIVLAAGLLLGMAAWQAVVPWLGIAIAVAAVVAACTIYRVDPQRRADEDLWDDQDDAGPEPDAGSGDERVSTPRRAAGRP